MYSLLTVVSSQEQCISFLYPPCSLDVLPAHRRLFPGTVYWCFCTLPVLQMYSLLLSLPRNGVSVFMQPSCSSNGLPTDCHLHISTLYQCSYSHPILQTQSILAALSSHEHYVTVCVSSLFCISHSFWFLDLNVANFNFSFKMLHHPPFSREGIKDSIQQTVTQPARYDAEDSTLNSAQYYNILMNGLMRALYKSTPAHLHSSRCLILQYCCLWGYVKIMVSRIRHAIQRKVFKRIPKEMLRVTSSFPSQLQEWIERLVTSQPSHSNSNHYHKFSWPCNVSTSYIYTVYI